MARSGLGDGAGGAGEGAGFAAAVRRVLATLAGPEERQRRPALHKVASCDPGDGAPSRGWGGPATVVAQAFVPRVGGVLRRVEVGVGKPPSTAGSFLVRVVRAPGGVPSPLAADVVAEARVSDATIPEDEEATLEAAFDGPELEAGGYYAVAVSRPGADEWAILTVGHSPCESFFTAGGEDPGEPFSRTVHPLALRFAVFVG